MSATQPRRLIGEHFRVDGTPKRRFATRALAIEYAERQGFDHLRIYGCGFCDGFHYATRKTPRWTR
jgi:hypothetical protein